MNKNIPLWTLAGILLVYATVFILKQNYEFLVYIGVVVIVGGLVARAHKNVQFSQTSLWGFTIWALLHMLGGSMYIQGTRLYDLMLFQIAGAPYYILRFDQVLHFFCYVVIAMLLACAVEKHLKMPLWAIYGSIVLMAIGVGALNEVVEFGAVVFLHDTGVGDYYNTVLDLVFNLGGAILGTCIALKTKKATKDL